MASTNLSQEEVAKYENVININDKIMDNVFENILVNMIPSTVCLVCKKWRQFVLENKVLHQKEYVLTAFREVKRHPDTIRFLIKCKGFREKIKELLDIRTNCRNQIETWNPLIF